eukprot:3131466-Lingulodinium_polyedra.AAC.1
MAARAATPLFAPRGCPCQLRTRCTDGGLGQPLGTRTGGVNRCDTGQGIRASATSMPGSSNEIEWQRR